MGNPVQHENRRDDRICRIIDSVLTQVFGQEATHLIYRYLESQYGLKQSDVSNRIDVFAKGLEEFLRSGAIVIERRILEDIYSSYGLLRRLELEHTDDESDFVGQVRLLMQKT